MIAIKIIGLSLLAIAMYGLGYFCGWIMTAIRYECDRPISDPDRTQLIKATMCDNYCRHPGEVHTQEALDTICEGCPLNQL